MPPQIGDVANRCALAVQYRTFPPAGGPGDADEVPSELDTMRADDRVAHADAVMQQLAEGHADAVVVDPAAGDRVRSTLAAMADGAPLVIGGVLPTDDVGRRRGVPLLLVRAERRPDGAWAYHLVDVRNHRTLERAKPGAEPGTGALVAQLDAPGHGAAVIDDSQRARRHQGDQMWLAHSHRMLAATAHGSSIAAGGVIGPEDVVVWRRLDVVTAQQRWDLPVTTDESLLDRYDREFSFRLDVLAAAVDGQPIVGPVSVGECSRCRWRPRCWPEIEAADSTSLLPGFGYRQWYNLARAGITTRAQVADLDLDTAAVRDALGDSTLLGDVVTAAATATPDTPVEALLPDRPLPPEAGGEAPTGGEASTGGDDRSESQPILTSDGGGAVAGADGASGEPQILTSDGAVDGVEAAGPVDRRATLLRGEGVATAADVRDLDPTVLGLAGQPIRRLAEVIQGARAAATGRPQLRRGLTELVVPGADVEIDIDMESGFDGSVYLWGALLDGRYEASVSWSPPGPSMEADVFLGFWDWLGSHRRRAEQGGRTLATYCWFRGAEAGALRSGARAAVEAYGRDFTEPVEEFLAGDQFVDLYEVFTTQLVTGGSAGLKTIAVAAGFAWRDEEPSGADSMAWHRHALDVVDTADPDPDQIAARRRLLAYNEDDVRATARVRAWMRTELG